MVTQLNLYLQWFPLNLKCPPLVSHTSSTCDIAKNEFQKNFNSCAIFLHSMFELFSGHFGAMKEISVTCRPSETCHMASLSMAEIAA